jgi:TRAP-type C4-dicarboxylate transport system substrate-binding protein
MKAVFFAAVLSALFCSTSARSQTADPEIELKWRLAHGPRVYSEYTAQRFYEELQSKLGGKISINVDQQSLNPRAVRNGLRDWILPQLRFGKLGIAQVYLDEFTDADDLFEVLSLPYLFRDHDHVTKVIEGPVGKRLLERLHAQGLVGLAFSYSGGDQIFLSGKKLAFDDPNFLKGLAVGNIGDFQRKALGMKGPKDFLTRVQMSEYGNDAYVGRGMIDMSLETYSDIDYFYNDFSGPRRLYLYGADYNVLFTAIVMNESYFKSLPASYQEAIRSAAETAARAERNLVISDSKKVRDQLDSGLVSNAHIAYVKPSERERAALRRAALKCYDSLDADQKSLVDEIANTK